MRVGSNRWLRGLFLSSVYLFGALGIIATGGGSGGSGVKVDSIDLDQPASRTYEPSILVTGNLVMIKPSLKDPGDKYSDSVKVKWRNHRTGKSGSENHKFSGSCVFLLVTVSCANHDESSLSIQIKLAIGSNKITVEADGKEASINVTRLDDRVPPGVPTNVSVLATNSGAKVAWDSVARSDSYNIYYASSPGVTKSNYLGLPDGTKLMNAVSQQDIAGLTNGTVYYFIVTAVNAYGESAESAETMTTVPGQPTGLSVLAADGGVEAAWNFVSGAVSYNIYLASSSGVTKANYSTLPEGTKLTGVFSPNLVSGLTEGITYYFVVTAVNW